MNILFTSVGRRAYLVEYFREVLDKEDKIFVSNNIETPVFKLADESIITPLIYDDNYIDFLLQYCKEKDINVVISLFDIDLLVLAKNKDKFINNNIKLIVADENFISICNDKYATYQFLIKNGFNTPKTYIDIEKAVAEVNENKLKFPLIIKPRWGMGSIAIQKVNTIEQLKVVYDMVKFEIFNSYLKYESKMDSDQCVVIQECINGQEYGADVINDLNGEYQNTIVRKKIAMRSGETDIAEIVNNQEISLIGEKLSKLSKHPANLDMDLFVTNENVYVLEMNCRFGGGYPFSHIAGVNLPKAIVNWCKGTTVEKTVLQPKIGTKGYKEIVPKKY